MTWLINPSSPVVSIRTYAIGIKIIKIIPNITPYLIYNFFSCLNLTKNITINGNNKSNPSYLIKDKIDANANEQYIIFLLSLKNNAKELAAIKIKDASVVPVNELSIILGSNMNIAAPKLQYI